MEYNQKPLTLEQLLQMDGRPAWLEDLDTPELSAWRLIYWVHGEYLVLISKTQVAYLLEDYGKTWLAYACKPIDFDKWEPCSACDHRGCSSCRHRGTWAELEPCRDCGDSGKQADRYKPLPFCPQCGRPLRPRSRRQLEKRIMEG